MIAIDRPPELTLNAEEIRLVLAYRAADDRTRREVLSTAEEEAAIYPRRTKSALRLVTGSQA